MKTGWMVRAGRQDTLFERFEAQQCVALGWPELGNLEQYRTQDELQRACKAIYSALNADKNQRIASLVWNFFQGIQKGDLIVSYCTKKREYILCEDLGQYQYDTDFIANHPHTRKVRVLGYKKRDALKVKNRNAVGITLPIFRLNDDVINDLLALPGDPSGLLEDEHRVLGQLTKDLQLQSFELIKDKLSRFDASQLRALTEGLLVADGWKVHALAIDEQPGTLLETGCQGAAAASTHLVMIAEGAGVLAEDALGDYLALLKDYQQGVVVTTGFASHELIDLLRKQENPIQIWDINRLAEQLVKQYDDLPVTVRALLPLTRLYWPG